MSIPILALIAFALNVPFGAWRATTQRFSLRWFLALHLPIPFVFLLRIESGHSWRVIPIMLAACIAGQLAGSWGFDRWRAHHDAAALAVPAEDVATDSFSR
jgi:hypothetical protein